MMRTYVCSILVMLASLGAASEIGKWDDVVKEYIEGCESVRDIKPTAYPWMAKRVKTLFGVRGVGHIQVYYQIDGKKTLNQDIYYKAGEVHIVNHANGWNLVTKGTEAYEWENGKKEGLITKLTDRDLIDYLLYVTDPSWIMTCFYHDVLYEGGKFLPPKNFEHGCKEWRFKEPVSGFRAVFVSEEPAWLYGFEADNPETGKTGRILFSKPESLKEVPARVFDRLKGIVFKKSNESIRRHMVYL